MDGENIVDLLATGEFGRWVRNRNRRGREGHLAKSAIDFFEPVENEVPNACNGVVSSFGGTMMCVED